MTSSAVSCNVALQAAHVACSRSPSFAGFAGPRELQRSHLREDSRTSRQIGLSGKDRRRSFLRVNAGLFEKLFSRVVSKEDERTELKKELLEEIAPLDRGLTANEDEETFIDELASRLERLNPTKKPLASPLLSGKWRLVYTTSESILGKGKPAFLRASGPIFQAIDGATLQARNLETWPFFNQVQATLTPTSDSSVDVKFDEFKILGLIPVKAPDSARGTLDITYLDEDMRISRGNRGNLFVLLMEDPSYRIPVKDQAADED